MTSILNLRLQASIIIYCEHRVIDMILDFINTMSKYIRPQIANDHDESVTLLNVNVKAWKGSRITKPTFH